MLASTNLSSNDQPSLSSIIPSSKLSFPNTSTSFPSSQVTSSLNTNSTSGRYSPSNFYRAAAVAAATSESNNRRYMPSTPVCYTETRRRKKQIQSKLDDISSFVYTCMSSDRA